MALTISLTKVSVSEPQRGMVVLTVNMTCLDGAEKVIDRDFTVMKKDAVSLATVKKRLHAAMQEEIDRYKREQKIFNLAAVDDAIADVEASLVG